MKSAYSFLLFVVLSCTCLPVFASSTVTTQVKEGSVKFKDFLIAAPAIANSKTSKLVNPDIGGKVISIKDKKYEIRFFSFEDTSGKLPVDTTFKEYIEKYNLLDSSSALTESLPGIIFESFDFRKFKLNDGVYFSMAIRAL